MVWDNRGLDKNQWEYVPYYFSFYHSYLSVYVFMYGQRRQSRRLGFKYIKSMFRSVFKKY